MEFLDEFTDFLSEALKGQQYIFGYTDGLRDLECKYHVDCLVPTKKKLLLIFRIQDTEKCKHATRTCLAFEKWGKPFKAIAIFKDQETIGRNALARLSDVCDKQFSSLSLNKDRIYNYLTEEMAA